MVVIAKVRREGEDEEEMGEGVRLMGDLVNFSKDGFSLKVNGCQIYFKQQAKP